MGWQSLFNSQVDIRAMALVYILRARCPSMGTISYHNTYQEDSEEVYLGIRTTGRNDRCHQFTCGRRKFRIPVPRRHEEDRSNIVDQRINTSPDSGMSDTVTQSDGGQVSASGTTDRAKENECRISHLTNCYLFGRTTNTSSYFPCSVATKIKTCRF